MKEKITKKDRKVKKSSIDHVLMLMNSSWRGELNESGIAF
jgi:hypothetical protein